MAWSFFYVNAGADRNTFTNNFMSTHYVIALIHGVTHRKLWKISRWLWIIQVNNVKQRNIGATQQSHHNGMIIEMNCQNLINNRLDWRTKRTVFIFYEIKLRKSFRNEMECNDTQLYTHIYNAPNARYQIFSPKNSHVISIMWCERFKHEIILSVINSRLIFLDFSPNGVNKTPHHPVQHSSKIISIYFIQLPCISHFRFLFDLFRFENLK